MYSANSHVYLYAKHWYKRSDDIIEDLKIIMAERCGRYNGKPKDTENLEDCKVSKNDVILVLLGITYPYIKFGGKHSFISFVSDIAPENCWRTELSKDVYGRPMVSDIKYDYYTAVAHKCLNILANTGMSHILEIEKEKIGEPDYNLFPMFKKEVENETVD